MAPDTDPTDEELAVVMGEVAVVVRERKAISDKWLSDQLAMAFAEVGLPYVPWQQTADK